MDPLLVIFSLAAAIAIALISISLLLVRLLLRRSAKHNLIRVKPLDIFIGIAQFVIAFIFIAWGRFHPESVLGRFVATDLGAIATIVMVGAVGCAVSAALQRHGIVLYYRVQSCG